MNKTIIFIVLLWPIFGPIAVVMRQAGNRTELDGFYQGYIILFLISVSVYIVSTLRVSRAIKNAALLIGLATIATALQLIHTEHTIEIGLIGFLLIILASAAIANRQLIEELFNQSDKLSSFALIFSFGIWTLFSLDYFGAVSYDNFDTNGLLPFFAATLANKRYRKSLLFIMFFLIAGKRAIFLASTILVALYYIKIKHNNNSKKNITISLYIFTVTALTVSTAFYLTPIQTIIYADSSALERVAEAHSALNQVLISPYNFLIGAGVAWSYELVSISESVQYLSNIRRSFTHISLIHFYITFGIIGLLFFVFTLIKLIKIKCTTPTERFLYAAIVVGLIVSFFRLNFFLEPWISITLISLLTEHRTKNHEKSINNNASIHNKIHQTIQE